MFLNDPSDVTGRHRSRRWPTAATAPACRAATTTRGTYSRIWSATLLDVGAQQARRRNHRPLGDPTSRATPSPSRPPTARTLADEQLGGFGQDLLETRATRQSADRCSDSWKQPQFKGGFEWAQHKDIPRPALPARARDRSQYTSIAPQYGAAHGGEHREQHAVVDPPVQRHQRQRLQRPDRARSTRCRTARSSTRRTTPTATARSRQAELGAVAASSTARPATRTADQLLPHHRRPRPARRTRRSAASAFFVQDEFTLGRLTLNLGLRAERWEHFSTTGDSIFTFDWTLAPRLSAAYDLHGRRHAEGVGVLGPLLRPDPHGHDQLRRHDQRLDARRAGVRQQPVGHLPRARLLGGAGRPFAPTTKTPYTDELQLGYESDLGHNMSVSAIYYNRRTRDIFEDFDPGIYTDAVGYPRRRSTRRTRCSSAGTTSASIRTTRRRRTSSSRTLKGGKRNYNGLELVFRKRFANSWQGLAPTATSTRRATPSPTATPTSRATCSGSIRARRTWKARCPGTIHHLFKAAARTRPDWGIELGGGYRWNSGTIVNKTQLASNRRLPIQVAHAVRVRRHHRQLGRAGRGWRGAESVVGPVRPARAVREARFSKIDRRSSSSTSSTCSTTRRRRARKTWSPAPAARTSATTSRG